MKGASASNTRVIVPSDDTGAELDAKVSLGRDVSRFKDLFLSGGVYLGGTVAANKLDDYEEGIYDPEVEDTSGTQASSYGVQEGGYRKVGDLVYFYLDLRNINASNLTSSSEIRISLPFTSLSQGSLIRYPVSFSPGNSLGYGGEDNVAANVVAGTDHIILVKYSSGMTSPAALTISELLSTQTNRDFQISGSYPV
jgi:hypothetical protein